MFAIRRVAVLLTAVLLASHSATALGSPRATEASAPAGVAAALQPFVDSHALAGAVTLVSPTELLVQTPPHAAGMVDVTVRNDATHLDVAPAAFTYVAIPLVPTRPNETRVITRTPD